MEIDKIVGCLERAKQYVCGDCHHPMSVGWCDKCGISKAIDEAVQLLEEYNAKQEEAYQNGLALGLAYEGETEDE